MRDGTARLRLGHSAAKGEPAPMHVAKSLLGILLILAIAFLLSSNRKAIRPRVVGAAFALQAGFAALVLYVPVGNRVLQTVSSGVSDLLGYAHAGVEFLFGSLAKPEIGGTSFAIAALPVIIFFAALISILYYIGAMQLVIKWIGGALEKLTGISRVESLSAASNIFVGQSESPLVIRPYLAALIGLLRDWNFNTDADIMGGKMEWSDATPKNKLWAARLIEGLVADGGTRPKPGFEILWRLRPKADAVFFMTDGVFEERGGEDEMVSYLLRNNKGPRAKIHCICFEENGSEGRMKEIARNSGGTYTFVARKPR